MFFTLLPDFCNNLVQGYCARYGDLHQKAGIIFVPNKVSCQHITEKFATIPSVLAPRIRVIGESNEEEYESIIHRVNHLKPVSAIRLRLIILELLQQYYPKMVEDTPEIFALAASLEKLYFQFVINEIDLSKAEKILTLEYQHHNILNHITIITHLLPDYLKQHNLINAVSYRYMWLKELSQLWASSACDFPIVIAGAYELSPTIINFMQTVNQLPYGAILLPHFNKHIETAAYYKDMYAFLDNEIKDTWYHDEYNCKHIDLLEIAFRRSDAKFTGGSLQLMRCYNEFATAQFISDNLITNDRVGVVTDDASLMHKLEIFAKGRKLKFRTSRGVLVSETQTGIFLQLILDLFEYNFSIIAILALFKHPYMRLGREPNKVNELIRAREISLYRRSLLDNPQRIFDIGEIIVSLVTELAVEIEYLAKVQHAWDMFYNMMQNSQPEELYKIFQAHLDLAEIFSTSLQEEGEVIYLWENVEIKNAFSELSEHIQYYRLNKSSAYKETYQHLLHNQYICPTSEKGENIYICTLEEAQLLNIDKLFIVNCDDEENYKLPPWLNRRLQYELGLTANIAYFQYKQQLSANILATKEVVFIHSEHEHNVRKIEPKLFLKLQALLNKVTNIKLNIDKTTQGITAKGSLHLEAIDLPSSLKVNMIESLMQDPYSFYAKYILKLKPLVPIIASSLNKEFSILVYNILNQAFLIRPLAISQKVTELAQYKIAMLPLPDAHKKIWLQKLMHIGMFVEKTLPIGDETSPNKIWTNLQVSTPLKQKYILESSLDLVIELPDSIHIYDLKTGILPSNNLIEAGLYPKLPLEGWIISSGGYKHLSHTKPIRLFYLRVTGSEATSELIELENSELLIAEAKEGLEALINAAPLILASPPIAPYYEYGIYNPDYIHLGRFA